MAAQVLDMVLQMHDLIHDIMEHQQQTGPSPALDSYGTAVSQPLGTYSSSSSPSLGTYSSQGGTITQSTFSQNNNNLGFSLPQVEME